MRTTSDNPRDPVERLAEKFLREVRAGKSTTIEDYQRRYPQHAAEIEALFPTLLMMEDLKPEMRRMRDSADTLLDRNVQQLGDFRIIRKIGFGGMGIVYEAQQESLDRPVAIKVFAPTLLSSPRLIRRFKREAKAAGTLHHSNIVPVLGVGEQWGIHFYIMQLIDGKGFDQVIDIHGKEQKTEPVYDFRRDWNRIADIGRQIASGLAYAHSRNVLHRDIKPANLLLDRDGTAWIADFGLAKLISHDDEATRTGQAVGTLRYMAPEQLEGQVDPRSDIYSLGLTLYELLTWRRAFDETDHGSLLRQKTVDVPPRPRSVDRSIPRDLETIVMKAMAREPAHRYRAARALEEDLERFISDEPIRARRVSQVERLVRWSKRNRALAAACVCVIALAASVLGLSLWGSARLQRALAGEKIERQRATATSTLATGALDSVFQRFGIEPIAGIGRPGEPMLSSEAAALLDNLLRYYEQLAEQDSNSPELMLKAAEAQAIIGNIRGRLGEHDAAVAAYRAAIAKYRNLPADDDHVITIAAIHNQLGQVLRFHGKEEEGAAEHTQAMQLLEPISRGPTDRTAATDIAAAQAARAQFEQARTHYLLAARVRPGMGPHSMPPAAALDGDDAVDELAIPDEESQPMTSLDAAIAILERQTPTADMLVRHQQLLARCLRERVHDNLVQRSQQETQLEERALGIMTQLVELHPENADYQFDLVEALAEFSVFANALDASVCEQAQKRLSRALERGEALVAHRPDVAAYALVVTHAHFKMATVLSRRARRLERGPRREMLISASQHLTAAIEGLSELIVRFPTADGFVVWQAFFHGCLGELYLDQSRIRQAQLEIQRAIELLEHISQSSSPPIVTQMRDWTYQQLDEVFAAFGAPQHLQPSHWALPGSSDQPVEP